MAGEQGTEEKVVTPPAGGDQGTGQGGAPATQPSTEQQPQFIELDGEKYTPEQIKELRQKASSYDELRPKYTKLTQQLNNSDDERGYRPGSTPIPGQQPNRQPLTGAEQVAAKIQYLESTMGKILESTEEKALEEKLTSLKSTYKDMDELEVLAALSVDSSIDIEEAAKFSDKKNKAKADEIRAAILAEQKENKDGVLEGAGGGVAPVPPAADTPKTIQDAGKRFLERLRASRAAAQ